MTTAIAATKFVKLPDLDVLQNIDAELDKRARANITPRPSKLTTHIPTIQWCLSQGKSYQRAADIMLKAHGMEVHRSTIKRFVDENPLLLLHRKSKLPQNATLPSNTTTES